MWNLILSFVNDVWASLCQFSRYYIKKKNKKRKWRSKLHVAVFFLRKDMLLCNYTRVVFSIDRYKLRDNRVQKQKPKYFFFFFEKCAIQKMSIDVG